MYRTVTSKWFVISLVVFFPMTISFKLNVSQGFSFRRKKTGSQGGKNRTANALGYLSILEWETAEGVRTCDAF